MAGVFGGEIFIGWTTINRRSGTVGDDWLLNNPKSTFALCVSIDNEDNYRHVEEHK